VRLVVTGGAGFIGSNFVRYMLAEHEDVEIVNLDKLTYAGNLENLRGIEDDPRYTFVQGDICDAAAVGEALRGADAVVNFAAETHVDRSILEAGTFVRTDVMGTYALLQKALAHRVARFVQISTDEVYGSIARGSFRETDPLAPNSPYSASKAGADMLVRAFHRTYGLPALITRSSNNYGPRQHVEKLIPLFVTNALEGRTLPLYGDGRNVRDWIYVDDNCRAIDLVGRRGKIGEVYNIGAGEEKPNIEIARRIIELTGADPSLLTLVSDRPGHDRRYSVATRRIKALGWAPKVGFDEGLARTVSWYRRNEDWWLPVKKGAFRSYYRRLHAGRLPAGKKGKK